MRRLFLKLFRRRRLEQDLEAELALHRELASAAGNPTPFGNDASIREQSRDLWRFNFFENLWRDLVYGARGLRHNPALVAGAVVSLALGIGANVAIFSLSVEFLFSEPSVRDASSLVSMRIGGGSHAPYPAIEILRDSHAFAEVAAENEEVFVNWNDGTETRRVFAVATTRNYFTALGVPVGLGRGYTESDPDQVVVLNNRFWRRQFHSDPSLLGRAINLDGKPYTVIGILPESHRSLVGFGYSPDLYLPRFDPDTALAIYTRLPPGMSIGQATAALKTVAERIDHVMPRAWKYATECEVEAIAGTARLRKDALTVGMFFVVLLVLVGLVLLIACVNVAGLLLARASTRRREIAIRLSLGAGRARLIQQMLVESLLLSVAGAAAGFALAQAIASTLAGIQLPLPFPIHLYIQPDWRVVSYSAALAIASTLACGLVPALQSVRSSISAHIHRESRMRLRRFLVAGQVAVCLVVLSVGFLFTRNLLQANSISPGFDLRHTVRAEVNLPPASYKEPARKLLYVQRALAALQALPGIEAVAAARIIPFNDATTYGSELTFSGQGGKMRTRFNWNAVTPDYFKAMEISIRIGRAFRPTENGKVVIVNSTFVERYLGNRPPLGQTFLWGDGKEPYQIVGVVEPTKNMSIGEDPRSQLYEPLSQIQNDRARLQFVLRSATPPAGQLAAVQKALRDLEPAAGTEVATLYASIGLAFLPSQVGAALMGSVGILGLILAAVGLYGTMMYAVARRTREIGVRMAIGASRAEISKMMLVDSARLVGTGSAVGLFIAWFVTKPLAAFLVPGLSPGDPISFLMVIAALALTCLLATLGPTRRAMTIDPASSLRYE